MLLIERINYLTNDLEFNSFEEANDFASLNVQNLYIVEFNELDVYYFIRCFDKVI